MRCLFALCGISPAKSVLEGDGRPRLPAYDGWRAYVPCTGEMRGGEPSCESMELSPRFVPLRPVPSEKELGRPSALLGRGPAPDIEPVMLGERWNGYSREPC